MDGMRKPTKQIGTSMRSLIGLVLAIPAFGFGIFGREVFELFFEVVDLPLEISESDFSVQLDVFHRSYWRYESR